MSSGSNSNPLTILYDTIRWEEKSLIEAAKKKGVETENIDIRNLTIRLDDGWRYAGRVVLQRSVSYFKSLHATAALEGLGASVINPLRVASITGNKMFAHMEFQKAGVNTPKAIAAFSEESAAAALEEFGYPAVIKPT
ncbi:MAG: lysine biosynthesis enzyme LysX, partial [Nitrososphaera sp.]